MQVKIKKLNPIAQIPFYAKSDDAGMDLVATGFTIEQSYTEYFTGLAIEIPQGYVGLIFPRSSVSNTELILANSVGVIDSGYRGEIKVRFRTRMSLPSKKSYGIGDKIAQLIIIPYPQIEFEEVDELSSTERGEGGFGSTNA
jgi:dUTP pyrophosphatase